MNMHSIDILYVHFLFGGCHGVYFSPWCQEFPYFAGTVTKPCGCSYPGLCMPATSPCLSLAASTNPSCLPSWCWSRIIFYNSENKDILGTVHTRTQNVIPFRNSQGRIPPERAAKVSLSLRTKSLHNSGVVESIFNNWLVVGGWGLGKNRNCLCLYLYTIHIHLITKWTDFKKCFHFKTIKIDYYHRHHVAMKSEVKTRRIWLGFESGLHPTFTWNIAILEFCRRKTMRNQDNWESFWVWLLFCIPPTAKTQHIFRKYMVFK